MKVLVVTTQVPFVFGGAELLAQNLIDSLRKHGHEAELVAIPFRWYPPEKILDSMLSCQLLDLSNFNGENVDKVIALKFPAYLIPHPNKTYWLLHQHRTAYELWGTKFGDLEHYPNGIQVRNAINDVDNKLFQETERLYTISINVAKRLQEYNQALATPIYHPPNNHENFFTSSYEPFFFFPSRINAIKRQSLVIRALAKAKNNARVVFAGKCDNSAYMSELTKLVEQSNATDKVVW
ncbi:MAG: glycosyltransferase family 1 protein, partial [Cyanobacteria bacterium P01_H01_bin.15]